MPGSMFCDLEQNGFEDQRALQLAFELSMLGLSEPVITPTSGSGSGHSSAAVSEPDTPTMTNLPTSFIVPDETRSKKSQNMTECVPVPSSEHVAEIVGRQGCKIKSLRAKTNTYIKTPVRGEEPVFVVTGRKEDVAKAKREILSAADHFSQIRASRKNNLGSLSPPGPPANVPGQVTIQVRVPYRVVGLVVGPKGATIKRIQHQTHTYIVTPSRDKEPVFEVTGLPEHVEAARRDIEAHIALRTGTGLLNNTNSIMDEAPEILASLCKTGLGGLFNYMDTIPSQTDNLGGFSSAFSAASSGCSSASSSSSSNSGGTGLGDIGSIWMSLDRDEGIGDSPSFETATASSSIWSFPAVTRPSPPNSTSPTESLSGKRDCIVCGEREVTAALVPCGHNLFCMECGERMRDAPNPTCPVCKLKVCGAIRILS